MTSREIIRRVLERDNPPRIGLDYHAYGDNPRISDMGYGGPTAKKRTWFLLKRRRKSG